MTPRAFAYEWTADFPLFARLPSADEHPVGLGLLTTGAALAAAVAGRRRPSVQLAAGAVLLVLVLTTMVHRHTLWRPLVAHLPALGAARALVRIGLLLPVAAAVLLGSWLDGAR